MLRKAFLSLFLFLAGVTLIELVARGIETSFRDEAVPSGSDGWQERFFERMGDWHEPDPRLLWRFKPNLPGPLIKTDANGLLVDPRYSDSTLPVSKILLLGDSSPVGLGLVSRDQAFGEQLEGMLEMSWQGERDFRLFNAAVSGYSSAQIARQVGPLLKKYQPDLVLVYCGNNDASISGNQSDEQLLNKLAGSEIKGLVDHLATYRLLRALILSWSQPPTPKDSPLVVRVSESEFQKNLEQIASTCRAAGRPVIFIEPVVPRLWPAGLQFKPFLHQTDHGRLILPPAMAELLGRDLYYCIDTTYQSNGEIPVDPFRRAVFESAGIMTDSIALELTTGPMAEAVDRLDPNELNNLGVANWRLHQYARADSLLKRAVTLWNERHTTHTPLERAAGSPLLYNLGINRWTASKSRVDSEFNRTSPGYPAIDSALQDDFFSLRIKRSYLDQFDGLAGPGVMVVTLDSLFAANGGEKLFVDHCHPTAEGHQLIALQLAKRIIAANLIK